jgi:hypothetical protein
MKLEETKTSLGGSGSPSTVRRSDYLKPKLIKYGDVAKLTAGSAGGHFGDAQSMAMLTP